MNIEIQPEPNVSIADLQTLQRQGFSVLRSAHVGNMRGYNLTLADAGIPFMLVDHNIVTDNPNNGGDRNYLPGAVVTKETLRPLPVSQLGGLSLKTTVEDEFVDTFHIRHMREAFPDTEIVTNTDYVRAEEAVSSLIVNTALATQPESFTRVVEADGTIRKAEEGSSFANLAPTYGILQLNDDPRTERGIMIPNDVDMLIGFVIEALRTQRPEQYHLSGPDMKQYTKDLNCRQRINSLFNDVRQRTPLGDLLPDQLVVKLVPTDEARFVTTSGRAPALQALFDLLAEKDILRARKGDFMRTNPPELERDAYVSASRQQEAALRQEIGEIAGELDELFVPPREAPFVSQYDAIETGLFMPSENSTLPMSALAALTKQLRKMRGSSP